MRLTAIQSNASTQDIRQILGPELCIIDLMQFMEVLRRQMVTGCEAVWEAVDAGALRISFPHSGEMDMVIAQGQWHMDPYRRQGHHLRSVN